MRKISTEIRPFFLTTSKARMSVVPLQPEVDKHGDLNDTTFRYRLFTTFADHRRRQCETSNYSDHPCQKVLVVVGCKDWPIPQTRQARATHHRLALRGHKSVSRHPQSKGGVKPCPTKQNGLTRGKRVQAIHSLSQATIIQIFRAPEKPFLIGL